MSTSTTETQTPEQKQKPEWRLKAGGLEVTCWKSIVKAENGDDRDFFSVSFQRSYKDKEGKWQHTQSLRRQDLLPMARLLGSAYDKLIAGTTKDEE